MSLAVVVASGADAERDGSDKRPGAFRTIGEVSDDLDIPQHVLRFWEARFAQVRPVKRAGGRRYYRPDDIDLLRGIKRLLHGQGYTIKGAQKVLRSQGVRFVQAVGRGEAEAEMFSAAADTAADTGLSPVPATALSEPDRAGLAEVLNELRACRALLVELGPDTYGT